MGNIKTYQLATVCFFCTTLLFVSKSRELKDELNTCNELKTESDSLCIEHSQSLLTYTLISLKQADIINRFKSSRDAKLNDKELQDLQSRLN